LSVAFATDGSLAAVPRTAAELARGLDERLHLGGQLYVSRAGEPLVDAAFGEARPGEPMRRDHQLLWMSSTKPVAAVAIAQLWERAALGLDDPVARHLPEFAQGGKDGVTIRHLLTHTSGLRLLDTGWPAASWEEIVARICARPLEPGWVPGRTAGYHLASSWFVLGELVRRLDGRPFERYVRAEIFAPLGMDGCHVGVAPGRFAAEEARIAPMYLVVGGQLAPTDLTSREKLVPCSPGGNGLGPLRELGRFYEMLLGGGALGDVRLLRPQTVEALVARHRVGLLDRTFGTRLDWGLGVILDSKHYGDRRVPYGYGPHAGARTFGHSGAQSSVAFADPDAALVVALALDGMPGEERHRERVERLLAALYEDLGHGDGATPDSSNRAAIG
jgi:CubicO group peptidase (beta-lactamase class C family)